MGPKRHRSVIVTGLADAALPVRASREAAMSPSLSPALDRLRTCHAHPRRGAVTSMQAVRTGTS